MTTSDANKSRNKWVLPFALGATLFGVGVVAGVLLTLTVQISSLPIARDGIIAGMAVDYAQPVPNITDPAESRPQRP